MGTSVEWHECKCSADIFPMLKHPRGQSEKIVPLLISAPTAPHPPTLASLAPLCYGARLVTPNCAPTRCPKRGGRWMEPLGAPIEVAPRVRASLLFFTGGSNIMCILEYAPL